jgi:hypothetical protein
MQKPTTLDNLGSLSRNWCGIMPKPLIFNLDRKKDKL